MLEKGPSESDNSSYPTSWQVYIKKKISNNRLSEKDNVFWEPELCWSPKFHKILTPAKKQCPVGTWQHDHLLYGNNIPYPTGPLELQLYLYTQFIVIMHCLYPLFLNNIIKLTTYNSQVKLSLYDPQPFTLLFRLFSFD